MTQNTDRIIDRHDQFMTLNYPRHPVVMTDGKGCGLTDAAGVRYLDMFSGFVDYTTTFDLGSEDGRVMLCLGKVEHMAEVWVNGKAVGYRLWPPFEFEITAAVRPGVNELQIRIGNLICNSMKQFVDENREYKDRLLVPVWAWSLPTPQDFDAGLLGPVEVKRLDRDLKSTQKH